MKAKIEFILEDELVLPINYNHILQGVILKWLNDESYQRFVHDEGYHYEGRKFKLFTFSKIFGRYVMDKANNRIRFMDKVYIYIGTKDEKFLKYLGGSILLNSSLSIGNTGVRLSKFEIMDESQNGQCIVKTVSPITIYSSFTTEEGRRKTYYYSPQEGEFKRLIRKNLIKKYEAYYGKECPNDEFDIELIGKDRLSVFRYEGFIIKGYNGRFRLSGSRELIDMALSAGLGGKNSMGLGCVIKVQGDDV